jgi:hypothetical protein
MQKLHEPALRSFKERTVCLSDGIWVNHPMTEQL